MWELVQQSPLLNEFDVHNHIPVSTTTSSDDNILIEREGCKDDDDQKIDDGADSTHALGQVVAVVDLGQVAALKTGLDEGRTEPSDGGIGGSEGEAAEGNGGHQGFTVAF